MSKNRTNKFIDTIDECLTNGVKNGIFQVSLQDENLNGREVTINGRQVINFGSCSYLGLEVDPRLKHGAVDAALRYGTQYSSSRLFSACNLYEELESQFSSIFNNNPAVLAATTTLAHLGALPILVSDDDLVILDHQVHGSVQLAVQILKARGTRVEMVKHNRMDLLEDIIRQNPNKYNKIWYMADGLYSMYGDYAPLRDIEYLLNKYPTFHFYVDDAHGMSWTGNHGNGYVLSQMDMHPKMVLTTSLAKGFGTGGGVTVLSDKEMMRRIVTCGSSYTYSGPVQPPMLGASIASAKIHLSKEIYMLQDKLKSKIELTGKIIDKYDLPLVLPSNSPIFYIGLGLPRVGYNMVRRLLNEGFYTNIGIFPGVPVKCCGLRLAITNGQTDTDIENVLDAFQYHLPQVLEEEGQKMEDISTNFNLPFQQSIKRYSATQAENTSGNFSIQHESTIQKIDKTLWNSLLADNGTFDWDGCRFLEETYCDNPEPENNWKFHYLIIHDRNRKPLLATFFTELLCKDDMIAPADVSRQVEVVRKNDRYHLTSKVIMMGSLMSLGDHLYINRNSMEWKAALLEMIRIMNKAKQQCGASMILLRDFNTSDIELRDFLTEEGFIRSDMFNDHVIDNLNWNSRDEFLSQMTPKSRAHIRKHALANEPLYSVQINSTVLPEELDEKYRLYKQVKDRGFEMNTFDLPRKFFSNLGKYAAWEIIELSLNDSTGTDLGTVGFGVGYRTPGNTYVPLLIGMNYELNGTYGIYRQLLYQTVKRAATVKSKRLFFGFGADIEKQKFGSKPVKKSVYIQSDDNYNMESLSTYQQINYAK
jgi:7-keto-8-aminopelargonate synthetase-like enzyme/predicted N-acyltransferase